MESICHKTLFFVVGTGNSGNVNPLRHCGDSAKANSKDNLHHFPTSRSLIWTVLIRMD